MFESTAVPINNKDWIDEYYKECEIRTPETSENSNDSDVSELDRLLLTIPENLKEPITGKLKLILTFSRIHVHTQPPSTQSYCAIFALVRTKISALL